MSSAISVVARSKNACAARARYHPNIHSPPLRLSQVFAATIESWRIKSAEAVCTERNEPQSSATRPKHKEGQYSKASRHSKNPPLGQFEYTGTSNGDGRFLGACLAQPFGQFCRELGGVTPGSAERLPYVYWDRFHLGERESYQMDRVTSRVGGPRSSSDVSRCS